MGPVVADTHTVLWYLLSSERISANAITALDEATNAGDPVFVASISAVEVVYLIEKGRLPKVALERLIDAVTEPETVASQWFPLILASFRAFGRYQETLFPILLTGSSQPLPFTLICLWLLETGEFKSVESGRSGERRPMLNPHSHERWTGLLSPESSRGEGFQEHLIGRDAA